MWIKVRIASHLMTKLLVGVQTDAYLCNSKWQRWSELEQLSQCLSECWKNDGISKYWFCKLIVNLLLWWITARLGIDIIWQLFACILSCLILTFFFSSIPFTSLICHGNDKNYLYQEQFTHLKMKACKNSEIWCSMSLLLKWSADENCNLK